VVVQQSRQGLGPFGGHSGDHQRPAAEPERIGQRGMQAAGAEDDAGCRAEIELHAV